MYNRIQSVLLAHVSVLQGPTTGGCCRRSLFREAQKQKRFQSLKQASLTGLSAMPAPGVQSLGDLSAIATTLRLAMRSSVMDLRTKSRLKVICDTNLTAAVPLFGPVAHRQHAFRWLRQRSRRCLFDPNLVWARGLIVQTAHVLLICQPATIAKVMELGLRAATASNRNMAARNSVFRGGWRGDLLGRCAGNARLLAVRALPVDRFAPKREPYCSTTSRPGYWDTFVWWLGPRNSGLRRRAIVVEAKTQFAVVFGERFVCQ